MSNSNQDRLIGRSVWGSSVVLSLKLKKVPLSLAHRLFGPRFSITEVIGFCNGNHIAERILTRVLHALNNLARTAGIEAASLQDMKCGIPIGGKVGWDFTPPPQITTKTQQQAEWIDFIPQRLRLLVLQEGYSLEQFLQPHGGLNAYHKWAHSYPYRCPAKLAVKLKVPFELFCHPMDEQDFVALSKFEHSREFSRNRVYCNPARVRLALQRARLSRKQAMRQLQELTGELSGFSVRAHGVSLTKTMADMLGISIATAMEPLSLTEDAELTRLIQEQVDAMNARAA